MLLFDDYDEGQWIAGVDEVGCGPLAGSVVAAAVILHPNKPIRGITDSKKISEKKRLLLAAEIKQKALAWSVASASVAEIDQINILRASLLAMKRAVLSLSSRPNLVLVDGKYPPVLPMPLKTIIKGDELVKAIGAASILAKVARDEEMIALDKLHPQYGFAKHKGYPTRLHLEKLEQFGALIQHRRSFKPVRKVLMHQ